jgi:hypothetical protein
MQRDLQGLRTGSVLAFVLFLINVLILERGFIANSKWYWLLLLTIPGLFVCLLQSRKR